MTLKDVKPGLMAEILDLAASPLKTRLMSMGFVKGTKVKVLRSAPFGDPMAVSIRSYVLALRVADAEKIEIKLV